MEAVGDGDDERADLFPCLSTPWPQLEPLLHFRLGQLIGIGMPDGSAEAAMGFALARHVAAEGTNVLVYAPHLPAGDPTPGLSHLRRPLTTAQRITDDVISFAHTSRPVGLVVVDGFSQLHAEEGVRLSEPEQAEDAGRRLKRLADDLTVLVTVGLKRPQPASRALQLSDLGLAAELIYHADVLALLERTSPCNVDVLIAKDRLGPAPYKTSVPW
ncbi:hypothetical protein [Streptomyces sp. NBC_00316]|uniref:hypothetical protein n=1 Tax=Streptomyces sp. NBC_00316 TaxID=2975710 RepID=UPI002E2A6839|nr:hypothetical protein [Streptomyces sp. NBC_00316]